MKPEVTTLGKRGSVIIPIELRKQLHLEEGDLLIIENQGDGILLKPAVALPIEQYSAKRKAEFLLSNATDAADYEKAREIVKAMGIDPDSIPHHKPFSKED